MLGASAGIAAWVVVVGGARMWARLTAIDVPASQTVTVLPRELLIAEGIRTLIVPLLLGGVIAIFTYLSRRADSESERASGRLGVPDDVSDRADAALTEAARAEASATSAATQLEVALRWAREIAGASRGEVDRQIEQLSARLSAAHRELRAAADRLRHVAAVTYELSAEAAVKRPRDDSGSRSDPVGAIGKRASDAAHICDEARASLMHLMAGVRGNRARDHIVNDIAGVRDGVPAAEVSLIVRDLHKALVPNALKWLIEEIWRLGPVEYLRWWIGRFAQGPGPMAAVAIVGFLLVAFTVVALVLINPDLVWMAIAAGASIVLFAGFMTLGSRGETWQTLALVVLVMALPLVALAGFLGAIGFQYTVYVLLLTALTAWVALGAMRRSTGAAATAWILFVAIAFWSGALAFIAERGADVSRLGTAVVFQKEPTPPVTGLYLGKTANTAYLASADECKGIGCRTVIGVPDRQVTCVVFGPPAKVHNGEDDGKVESAEKSYGPEEIQRAALAGYPQATGTLCDGPDSGTDDKPPQSGDSTVTRNRWNFLNRLQFVIARPSRPGPAPAPDVRVIGPFRIVLGGRSEEPEPSPARGGRVVLGNVLFRFGSAELTLHARANIAVSAREIRGAGAKRVFLAGHADEKGSEASNVRLSRRRATAVESALRSRLPATMEIIPRGYGERLPLACNRHRGGTDSRRGRSLNRRVEIRTRRLMTWEERGCRP